MTGHPDDFHADGCCDGPIRARKRPVVVDAYRYTGLNAYEVAKWVGHDAYVTLRQELIIRTTEGDHKVDLGDWVMRGTRGEHYPIKPVVFDDVYDEVPA